MSLESTVAELVRQTTTLLQSVNLRKEVLDEKANIAVESAGIAQSSSIAAVNAAQTATGAVEGIDSSVTTATEAASQAVAAKQSTSADRIVVTDLSSQVVDLEESTRTNAGIASDASLSAQESMELATKWASEEEDVLVEGVHYSAYHYMRKSEDIKESVDQSEGVVVAAAETVSLAVSNMPNYTVANTLPEGIPEDGDIWITLNL